MPQFSDLKLNYRRRQLDCSVFVSIWFCFGSIPPRAAHFFHIRIRELTHLSDRRMCWIFPRARHLDTRPGLKIPDYEEAGGGACLTGRRPDLGWKIVSIMTEQKHSSRSISIDNRLWRSAMMMKITVCPRAGWGVVPVSHWGLSLVRVPPELSSHWPMLTWQRGLVIKTKHTAPGFELHPPASPARNI